MAPTDSSRYMTDEFECEIVSSKYYNLIRPCERYWELYKSCKSIGNRINQYYVYGETLDCEPHQQNYQACMEYRKTGNLNVLDSIMRWENNLINTRLKTVEQNKVWEMRDEPPKEFDAPLPDFILKRQSRSIFRFYNDGQ